jgi:hypothetical protein
MQTKQWVGRRRYHRHCHWNGLAWTTKYQKKQFLKGGCSPTKKDSWRLCWSFHPAEVHNIRANAVERWWCLKLLILLDFSISHPWGQPDVLSIVLFEQKLRFTLSLSADTGLY